MSPRPPSALIGLSARRRAMARIALVPVVVAPFVGAVGLVLSSLGVAACGPKPVQSFGGDDGTGATGDGGDDGSAQR